MKSNAKVTHGHLHQAQFVPGIGDMKRTINQQFYPGIDLTLHPAGVLMKFNGVVAIIPYVNFQVLIMEED